MNEQWIRMTLKERGLPAFDKDLPYIRQLLQTVNRAEQAADRAPYLNMEVPITVVDKELLT
jgi:hypothetical protein